jgi:hypothetical protein
VSVPSTNRKILPDTVDSRKHVDAGEELSEDNTFDSNSQTEEKAIAREKLNSFAKGVLEHLKDYDGANSGLRVFCRIDVGIFVDEDKRVMLFVNEIERGLTTCLWCNSGPSAAGNVGSDMAWPLACWILDEKRRLGV